MTTAPSDGLDALDQAMRHANLRHDLEERSFYQAARSLERQFPLTATTELAEAKRRLIADTVAVAPLAAHIVKGSRIACPDLADPYAREGAASCFRVHEILRKTRRHPEARILLHETPIAREELLKLYRLLTPNTNLEPFSPFTLYTLPRIVLASVAGGIVLGVWMGREDSAELAFDLRAAVVGGGVLAVGLTLLGQFAHGRNLARTAPWNAALYNDLQFFLYQRQPDQLHLARAEYLERNQLVKGGLNGRRYHERAAAIEAGAYVEVLRRRREQQLAAAG